MYFDNITKNELHCWQYSEAKASRASCIEVRPKSIPISSQYLSPPSPTHQPNSTKVLFNEFESMLLQELVFQCFTLALTNKINYNYSYSACIRRAAGYCCIEYQVCAGVTSGFTLDGGGTTNGYTDTYCTGDYVAIPGKCIKI